MSDDPRDPTLEVRISKPKTWVEDSDAVGSFSMILAGATMVTRNRQLAWPSVAVALAGWVNQHPLRTKEGGSGIGPILFAFGALATSYLPMMVLQTTSSAKQTPLSV
ncbi:hypothetical protein M408DRAFT_331514 [Serendipita vermifera MAFF 305830]|uniref:Protein Asterix n=1 Tax=Serendipita vermifera MAFF 305830 TaxID=933852 RepID=A0A0C3AZY9_SERVB|nr:hypothetical protein M408DRAFT_331514 [Serendipita vermifera MAFF 305830]